jgi:dihydropyrimidinase
MSVVDYDVLVTGGVVATSVAVRRADIGVRDGKIVAVGLLEGAHAREVIEANDCFVLPGLIDAHTHPVYADDLASLSAAAAAGGVTTVLSHLGDIPAWGYERRGTATVIEEFIRQWDGRVACDFGIHAAFDGADDPSHQLDRLTEFGIYSFKFFMAYRKRGMMSDDRKIVHSLELIGKAGGVAIVHAENGDGIDFLEARYAEAPMVPRERFLECHTDLLEAEAVLRIIALADAASCPIYIPHIAGAAALAAAELGRRSARVPVFVETCPHYLLLTNDEVLRRGALAKIAPPLRRHTDNEAVWKALRERRIQVIATDHAPRTRAEKEHAGNLLQAPFGAESIEHLLPLVYSGVCSGEIDLSTLVATTSEFPAKLFGLWPRKGSLQPGADADIVVFDPLQPGECRASGHVSKSDYCLYEGRKTCGTVRRTLRRGVLTFDGLAPTGVTGGQFLRRQPVPAEMGVRR